MREKGGVSSTGLGTFAVASLPCRRLCRKCCCCRAFTTELAIMQFRHWKNKVTKNKWGTFEKDMTKVKRLYCDIQSVWIHLKCVQIHGSTAQITDVILWWCLSTRAFRENTVLPTPWFQTSGPKNREKIDVSCSQPPGSFSSGPVSWKRIQHAPGDSSEIVRGAGDAR